MCNAKYLLMILILFVSIALILNKDILKTQLEPLDTLGGFTLPEHPFIFWEVTFTEVSKNGTDMYDLSTRLLNSATNVVAGPLSKLINSYPSENTFLRALKRALFTYIHKKENDHHSAIIGLSPHYR